MGETESTAKLTERIQLFVTPEQKRGIDEIAFARSSPGQIVNISEIIREAIDDFLAKHRK